MAMDWAKQCAVVIPCRNEARFIGPLVQSIRQILPHVIVVNDASTDSTAREAQAAGAEVLAHPTAQGKGAALRTGWKQARVRQFEWVLCMDGDGQHAPSDIRAFLRTAESTGASLVVGNRMGEAHKMPLLRRWVNRWMSSRLSAMAGQSLPDSQCGYRLVRLSALEQIPLKASQFEIESEQLLAFVKAGERVEFVPVEVIYRTERSKIHPLRDTLRWFRWRREWRTSSASPKSTAHQNRSELPH